MHDGIDATEKLNVGFLIIRQEFTANPKGGRSHPYDLGRRDVDFFQLLSDLGILLTADAEIAKHLAVQGFDYFGCHGYLCKHAITPPVSNANPLIAHVAKHLLAAAGAYVLKKDSIDSTHSTRIKKEDLPARGLGVLDFSASQNFGGILCLAASLPLMISHLLGPPVSWMAAP